MAVPKLRFNNYSSFWKSYTFDNLFEICSSRRVLQKDWHANEEIPFYRTREIISLIENTKFSQPIYISDELYQELKDKYGVPKENDLLVTGIGSIGEIYKVNKDEKFYFKDGNVLWFKSKNKTNSIFMTYLFKTKFLMNQIKDSTGVTTVATYSIENAKKTIGYFPDLSEQNKISSFPKLVDFKLEKKQKKLELLKLYNLSF